MASPHNSFPEAGLAPQPVPPLAPVPVENPIWNGIDLLQMIGLILIVVVMVPLALVILAHLSIYKRLSLADIAVIPEIILISQLLIYAAVYIVMRRLVDSRGGTFWDAIRWKWPQASWGGFAFLGVLLYFALTGLGQFLPIPKHLPMDRFFQTTREASMLTVIAVTLAPLMEELFFRGFLYPVLARKLGAVISIVLTGALFGLLHGAQLGYSWAVLIIFLVGIVLTTVRAVTRSVASSFLVHVGYNGTLSALLFVATSGFRHMEKLTQ